jgi:UDP-glucose 4-epimerase
MNVVVTGGAGFIGTHLTKRLATRGHAITVLDNLRRSSEQSIEELSKLQQVRLIEGDIRDDAVVDDAVAGSEVVFHLAAQSNVMGAAVDATYNATTNVIGTVNVLTAARESSVRRVVFASSREAYGEARYLPVDEAHPTTPKNLYGASKVAGEAYCRAFAGDGLDVAILRLANVYGAGDSDRVIPLFAAAAERGEQLTVFGGTQVLDFVWIETVLDAFELAASNGIQEVLNIGTGHGTTILELAERVIAESGSSSFIDRREPRAIEVTRFVADTTRMKAFGIDPDREPLAHLAEFLAQHRSLTSSSRSV